MSYGLTPYDRKTYKESKKRIKQAQIADETGRILPIQRRLRIIPAVTAALIIIAAAAAAVYFTVFCNWDNTDAHTSDNAGVQTADERELTDVVNRSNPLSRDYIPNLVDYKGFKINAAMRQNLERLIDAAGADGIELRLTKAYTSFDEQQQLYEQKLNEILSQTAYTRVKAEAEAQKYVPKAGNSEFQTGLLVEFDISNAADKAYLERNCVNFGFVQRYTADKEDITGIKSSDGIYRYVGEKNAVNMRSFDMCLEQYSEYISVQKGN